MYMRLERHRVVESTDHTKPISIRQSRLPDIPPGDNPAHHDLVRCITPLAQGYQLMHNVTSPMNDMVLINVNTGQRFLFKLEQENPVYKKAIYIGDMIESFTDGALEMGGSSRRHYYRIAPIDDVMVDDKEKSSGGFCAFPNSSHYCMQEDPYIIVGDFLIDISCVKSYKDYMDFCNDPESPILGASLSEDDYVKAVTLQGVVLSNLEETGMAELLSNPTIVRYIKDGHFIGENAGLLDRFNGAFYQLVNRSFFGNFHDFMIGLITDFEYKSYSITTPDGGTSFVGELKHKSSDHRCSYEIETAPSKDWTTRD